MSDRTEDRRSSFSHDGCVSLHHVKGGTDVWCEIDLVRCREAKKASGEMTRPTITEKEDVGSVFPQKKSLAQNDY